MGGPIFAGSNAMIDDDPADFCFQGEVEQRRSGVFRAEIEVGFFVAEVDSFGEREGEKSGPSGEAIPNVVGIVFDVGVVGKFVLIGPFAVAIEREEWSSGEVVARDRNVGIGDFEVFPEDELGC